MKLDPDSMKPIYIQIADWLESEILSGRLPENERIYSQYQLSEIFNVNPATAAKGLNCLAEEKIVYKQRGLGMFVSPNAKQYILEKRRSQVLRQMVDDLVLEAFKLGLNEQELVAMVHHAIERTGQHVQTQSQENQEGESHERRSND